MILSKNVLSFFISAKYNKNRILKDIIQNIIDLNSMSKLTDPINEVLPILNIKLANSVVILSISI